MENNEYEEPSNDTASKLSSSADVVAVMEVIESTESPRMRLAGRDDEDRNGSNEVSV
jgi:hypothetical protein